MRAIKVALNRFLGSKGPSENVIKKIFAKETKGIIDLWIVQIGSNDGKSNSDPIRPLLMQNRHAKAILVEAVPEIFTRLKANYHHIPNISFENVAVGEHEGTAAFFMVPKAMHSNSSLLGSLSKQTIEKHERWIPDLREGIISVDVPVTRLETLLTKHQIGRIDVFHTDVEGYDFSILQQFDFQLFRPKVYLFEHKHMSKVEVKASLQIFARAGYSVEFIDEFDAAARQIPKVLKRHEQGVVEYTGELGPELQICLPYVYYLHLNGLLKKTIGCSDTKCFYYFSPNHEEILAPRKYKPFPDLPNRTEHMSQLDKRQWIPPPYRDIYRNDRFIFNKELVVVMNKYNSEWDHAPVNFIDLNTLRAIFAELTSRYKVIYNRPNKRNIVNDNSIIYNLADFELAKEFPEVLTIQDLHKKSPDISFNCLQMMVMANCRKFISVQGGNSVLASYFGGVNIVFMREGKEISHGDYDHYPDFAGTTIEVCDTYSLLLETMRRCFGV